MLVPAAVLVMVGLGFKASLAPFFQWTPDTYEGAPTPVTAYLSTASKAVGFAVIARVMLVAFAPADAVWVPILGGLAVLTMFAGNLMALRQTNVKRMLAYSSIAQAGYMLLGLVSVVNTNAADVTSLAMNGLNGLLIYLFGYLFTNIGAFMVVLAVENMTGGSDYVALQQPGEAGPWPGLCHVHLPAQPGRHSADGRLRGQVLCLWRHRPAPVLLPGRSWPPSTWPSPPSTT